MKKLSPFMPAHERILAHSKLNLETGCIEYQGWKSNGGYGVVRVSGTKGGKRKASMAHRVVFAAIVGPIPTDKNVLHKCDNPSCVNVAHLFLGTQLENVRDCAAKGRRRYSGRKGEENHKAKLTESAVLDIRASLKNGVTQNALAAKYAVTQELISRVKLRKAWKHI